MRSRSLGLLPERGSLGRRILVVDGDAAARAALARQLAPHIEPGMDAVATGAEALALVDTWRFDMLLVEFQLPDIGGCELCRMLRERRFAPPIIMLGASSCEDDAILALDAGANDFVAKPYHLGLLLARLRAHLRQFERSEDAVLEIGRHVFDCGRRLLTDNTTGRRIVLTAKEAALLRYLYLNRDRAVHLGAIMRDVWGYRADVETHTAETHIYRLRRKMEPDPAHPRILVRGAEGYRLTRLGYPEPAATPPPPATVPSRQKPRRLQGKLAVSACVPLLVFGLGLLGSSVAPANAALRSPRLNQPSPPGIGARRPVDAAARGFSFTSRIAAFAVSAWPDADMTRSGSAAAVERHPRHLGLGGLGQHIPRVEGVALPPAAPVPAAPRSPAAQ